MTIPIAIPVVEPLHTLPLTTESNSTDYYAVSQNGVTYKQTRDVLADAIRASISGVPIGSVMLWCTPTPPTGWLICNGSAISRTTYSALNTLFSAASYPFGPGNGSTTFNIPDLRGRVPMGAGTGSGLTARTLGSQVGSEASAGTDTPTITVGSTTVTGSVSINSFTSTGTVSINPFTSTGSVTVNPVSATFSGTAGSVTGSISLSPHHHSVVLPAVTVAADSGINVVPSGTYTTDDVTVTGTFTGDDFTPVGTISVGAVTASLTMNQTSPIASLAMNPTSPTGTVTLNSHSHSATSSTVNITTSTIQPSLVMNFIIKYQ